MDGRQRLVRHAGDLAERDLDHLHHDVFHHAIVEVHRLENRLCHVAERGLFGVTEADTQAGLRKIGFITEPQAR